MNKFKNSKILKVVALIILGVVALIIIIWSIKSRPTTTPSNYRKSIEISGTQPKAVTVEEEFATTVEGDYTFSKFMGEINDKYPWYGYMPIDTSDYTIVWDFDKIQFRIRLKISSTSPQNTKDILISRALVNLKKVTSGDFDKYGYYVLYMD
jgi:hypothetical protein